MKKYILTLVCALFCMIFFTNDSSAQVLLGLPYQKEHTNSRKPMPYQYVREADVMWSKIVWRRIQLSERANQHLYYPTTPQDGRKSLIDVLLDGIHTQGLTAYNSNGDDEFATILTEKEIEENLGTKTSTIYTETEEGETVPQTVVEPYSSSSIKSYQVKELWYFDKQRSVLEVRIIGISPIRVYYREDDQEQLEPKQKQCFWIYYPEVRKILSNAECFNPKNDGPRLNYEDIFQKRYFTSYIEQESNIYDNRMISEYQTGEEVLLESERIKENIFNFEQDLWEY